MLYYDLSSPKFISIFLLYGQQFSRYRLLWNKCTEWPQTDVEHYEVIGTHIYPTSTPKFKSVSI